MASPAYFVDSAESARNLFGLMNPDMRLYDVEDIDGAASLYKLLNPGELYKVDENMDSAAALYREMYPDQDIYKVDNSNAQYALYAKQNPGTEYMSSSDHIWDAYGRKHYDKIKSDPAFGRYVLYNNIDNMGDVGAYYYHYYGKGRGEEPYQYANAIYNDGKLVESSELPDFGIYNTDFENITDQMPHQGFYDADFNPVTKGVHDLYRGPGSYLSDGRAFHDRLLPELGYYDENFNKINPAGNSALANIYRYKQNEDAPRQEYYNPMEFPEMELNPIAQRNLELRNNIGKKRAPEAQYENNYIEWMKPQDDLMEEFIGNVTKSGLKDEGEIRDIMTAFAKQKYNQGVGSRDMPKYRLAQESLEQSTRDTSNYMSAMNRLYQPLTRNSRHDFGEPTRGLGEMNMSRGLSALMGSSPNSSFFSDAPTNFLSQLVSQQPTQTAQPTQPTQTFSNPILGNLVNGREVQGGADRFASPALSENINEDILAKIFNPSLGLDELNQQIKDEIRNDDVAGIAKVLAKDLDDRTLDDREYLGLVDAPLEQQMGIGLISPDFNEEAFPYETLNEEQQEYVDKGGKVSDMFAAGNAKKANRMIETAKTATIGESAIASLMNDKTMSEGSKQGLLAALSRGFAPRPNLSGRSAYELAPPTQEKRS